MELSPKMKQLDEYFDVDHEDLSGAILELNARMDKFEEKVNKKMQSDACVCQNREYWVDKNANFCGACGGSLRTAD